MESLEGSEEAEDQSFLLASETKKKYVKSSVNIHDRNQLETAFDYKIFDSLPKKSRKQGFFRSKYKLQVEVYLFFPPGMGISPHTYHKQQFYEDLNPYIRLKEPRLGYKELLGLKKPKQSPLQRMRIVLEQHDKLHLREQQLAGVECSRIFACSFSAYFLKRIQRRCKKLEKAVNHSDSKNRLAKIDLSLSAWEPQLRESLHVLKEWYQLYCSSKKMLQKHAPELQKEMLYALEYCHYRFREGLAKLIHTLNDSEKMIPENLVLRFRKNLMVWLRLQRLYAHTLSFKWINEQADEAGREGYFSRLNSLKKRMWQTLYLEVKPRRSFLIRKQLAYMLAAGFAAIWALLADLWIRFKLPANSSVGKGVNDFLELSGLLVIIAFVLAYVMKDRIKETARSRLNKGILGKNPDYSEQILWKDLQSKAHNLGTIQEWMSFISSEKSLPHEVEQIRAVHGKKRLFSGEQVVCYRKTIELKPKSLKKIPFSTLSLRDIIRINVKRYITRLGDPVSSYLCLSEKHGSVVLPMPKSYYLDMVLRYSYLSSWRKYEGLALDFNRLVLNKDGLVRIERL